MNKEEVFISILPSNGRMQVCCKFWTVVFVLFLLSNVLSAQTPADEYFGLINLAEKEIVQGDLSQALEYYDSAFVKFNYPFYRNLRQATIIASYSDDQKKYHELLKRCIRRGMTANELKFFEDNNPAQDIISRYDLYHNEYLASIDTFVLDNYLELDMLERRILLLYGRKDSDIFWKKMKQVAKMYEALVDSIGYPEESKIGLSYQFLTTNSPQKKIKYPYSRRIRLHYHENIAKKGEALYAKVAIQNLSDKPIVDKPGNWFVSHYHTDGAIVDSVFYDYLQRGVGQLKLNPVVLAYFLERTGLDEHEFLMTYYSKLNLSRKIKMKWLHTLSLDEATKARINKNRKSIFVRPVEMELELVKALYRLEYGHSPEKVNKKVIRAIPYQMKSFIRYF